MALQIPDACCLDLICEHDDALADRRVEPVAIFDSSGLERQNKQGGQEECFSERVCKLNVDDPVRSLTACCVFNARLEIVL